MLRRARVRRVRDLRFSISRLLMKLVRKLLQPFVNKKLGGGRSYLSCPVSGIRVSRAGKCRWPAVGVRLFGVGVSYGLLENQDPVRCPIRGRRPLPHIVSGNQMLCTKISSRPTPALSPGLCPLHREKSQ